MKKLKFNILFFLFVLLLLFHLLLFPLNWITDSKLEGWFLVPEKPVISLDSFMSGALQKQTELVAKYNLGLRPGLTRIHHQIEYNLFDKLYANDCYKGKDDYLFEYKPYFYNKTWPDTARFNKYAKSYIEFSDAMRKKGKQTIWVIAPEKCFVYSEYLPQAELYTPETEVAQYIAFKNTMEKNGIPLIDFNALAILERDKSPYPVMKKSGKHWARAYATRCFDSLIKYMNKKFNYDIQATPYYKKNTMDVFAADYDIATACNLLYNSEKRGPSEDGGINPHGEKKVKVLLGGDSFCHVWVWSYFLRDAFHPESEFWYYNHERNTNDSPMLPITPKDYSEIEKFDCIIFMYSGLNLPYTDRGLIDSVNLYHKFEP